MGLTSATFVWGMTVLSVLIFGALVALWRPMARPQWWWYAVRAVALLLLVSVSLVAVAAHMNRKEAWYASWSDLIDPKLEASERTLGGEDSAAVSQPVGDWGAAAVARGQDAKPLEVMGLTFTPRDGGRVATVKVTGSASGHTGSVMLWVPESYFVHTNSATTYPVLMFMHGMPGGPGGIITDFRIGDEIRKASAARTLRDTIVVVPELTPGGVDSECVDSSTLKMETWLARDVPGWLAAHARVAQDRRSWAVQGYSAGGFCAALLTVRHPDTFAAGIVMAGYFRPDFTGKYRPFAPGSPQYAEYDLGEQVRAQRPPAALWVQSSKTDQSTVAVAHAFAGKVASPTSVEDVVLASAGHRWVVWKALTPRALAWLGEASPGFAPLPS